MQGWSNTVYGSPLVEGDNYLYLGNGATWFEAYVGDPYGGPLSNIWWEYVGGDNTPYYNMYRIGFDLSPYGGYNYNLDSYYTLHFTDDCGSHAVPFHFMHSNASPPYYRTQGGIMPPKQLTVRTVNFAPNPAGQFVMLSLEEKQPGAARASLSTSATVESGMRSIKIYDLVGKLLQQQDAQIPSSGYRLDVSKLRSGNMYIVVVEDRKGNRFTGKLMKQ
jgi:hypothetical protein